MMPPNDSPFWGILKLAVVGAIFIVGANFLYKNGWDTKDWIQLLAILLGSSGVSAIQQFASKA